LRNEWEEANFRNANCTEAIFRQARAQESHFTNSNLYAADLSEGDFSQSVFRKANLNQANLQGSLLASLQESGIAPAEKKASALQGAIVPNSR
jgi:uncharacterized protein YjbI with pentapeptide repeats